MNRLDAKGFTLIEIMMVMILIAVLAAVAINAFINFRTEAREASLRSNLRVMRSAIMAQYSQMQLRCAATSTQFPAAASIIANDITDGNSVCTTGQVASTSDRRFFQGSSVPQNPFVSTPATTVTACATGGCNRADGTNCNNAAGTGSNNWCYNEATGDFWLDRDTYKSW